MNLFIMMHICILFVPLTTNTRFMSDLQTYAEAVRVIKEVILRSQYRAASAANKEQLSLYYGMVSMFLKTLVRVFGVKVR